MSTSDPELSIDEVDRLLDGHLPAGRPDLATWATDLASLSAAYDRDVDLVDIRRWAAQAAAHARLAPTDNGDLAATSASNANRPASQASGLPKRRIPVLDSIAAFLATTLGKTVAAGALVAATTTGGLAATNNLPGQDDPPAPVPASVEDESDDPGGLDLSDLDEVDGAEDSPDAVEATDDDDDEACVDTGGGVAAASVDAPVTGDDADDDEADDEADDDESCESEVESTDVDESDDLESDDADEVDDADEADDESDDADDDAEESRDGDEAVTPAGVDSSGSDSSDGSDSSGGSDHSGSDDSDEDAPAAAVTQG